MQVPPKQRISITPFDQKTQREAFSVSLEGLKGWNVNTLILESAQAREDRKRRKELKKLAKSNVMPGPLSATSPTTMASTNPFAAPTPGSSIGNAPKPTRPPPVQIPTNNHDTPHGGTPRPTPTSVVSQQQLIPNPGTPTEKRGKKRDHEEASKMVQNRSLSQQNGVGTPRPGVLNGNGMPRAIKKQRMDMNGQARDMPVQQQPTPQGV